MWNKMVFPLYLRKWTVPPRRVDSGLEALMHILVFSPLALNRFSHSESAIAWPYRKWLEWKCSLTFLEETNPSFFIFGYSEKKNIPNNKSHMIITVPEWLLKSYYPSWPRYSTATESNSWQTHWTTVGGWSGAVFTHMLNSVPQALVAPRGANCHLYQPLLSKPYFPL